MPQKDIGQAKLTCSSVGTSKAIARKSQSGFKNE